MNCEKCIKMTDWYIKENPEKRGYVLCEICYEKSKEHIVYLNLEYKPKDQSIEERFNDMHKNCQNLNMTSPSCAKNEEI